MNDFLENKSVLNKVLKEGKNNHIIISGNLADELEEFDQVFKNLKALVHNVNLENTESLTTVGVFNNFTGYINGYELGFNFKNIKEIAKNNVIINLGNDNKKFLK